MNAAAARFGGGFFALAAIWVGVYWMWEPSRSAGVSFADQPEAAEREAQQPIAGDSEVREVEPTPIEPDPTPPPVADEDPPAGDPEEGVIQPQFRDYTIQRGDTFESIARRFFGASSRSAAIAAANPLTDPNRLREGQVIRVPLDPDNIQGQAPEGAEPELPEPEFVEYTVVKRDTLSEIAQHFYGSLRYADVIFNANRDTMSSMNDLQIGQVLRIPSRKSVLGEDGTP